MKEEIQSSLCEPGPLGWLALCAREEVESTLWGGYPLVPLAWEGRPVGLRSRTQGSELSPPQDLSAGPWEDPPVQALE